MRNLLQDVLYNYLEEKSKKFSQNRLAGQLRKQAPKIIHQLAQNVNQYKIVGSAGQGQWADIPWIAIMNPELTKTATQGYYLVYLFNKDMSGVYLSLNQGWEHFKKHFGMKEGKRKIVSTASKWREILTISDEYNLSVIDLKSERLSYELGHICGKYYPIRNLPSQSDLLTDLNQMLTVYEELIDLLPKAPFEYVQNYVEYRLDEVKESSVKEQRYILNEINQSYRVNLIKGLVPLKIMNRKNEFTSQVRVNQTDYLKKYKNQKTLGLLGESIILKYLSERQYINGGKRIIFIDPVAERGLDHLGYDIEVTYEDGNQEFIEVKTTTKSANESFYMSANEVMTMNQKEDKYFIYRLYNLDLQNQTADLYIYNYKQLKALTFTPIQYSVN